MKETSVTFSVDEEELAHDVTLDPVSQPAEMLFENFFIFPVRVVVGGSLVFAESTAMLHVASFGLSALRHLRKTQELRMPHTGDILFTKLDGDVLVSYGDGSGRASYEEILAAWQAFEADVARFVVKHFPEMRTHRQLHKWFEKILVPDE